MDGEAAELWRLVAQPRRGLTRESRAGQVVRLAEDLLAAGGDVAGVLPESFLPDRAEVAAPWEPDAADYVAQPTLARGGDLT